MANKIRLGILGGGGDSLIGILHRVAAQMFDRYEIVGGVFNPNFEQNKVFATKLGLNLQRIYKDLDHFIEAEMQRPEAERIEVVSVLTPNFLHYPMAKTLIENGFHVICEKPLTTTYDEALHLQNLHQKHQKVFAVTYTYTGYPMIRQLREMIAQGTIGAIQKIDIQYYQGWINPIIHDEASRKNTWRLNPEKSGSSCCIGDIGTHAFDMLEYVSGLKVNQLLADLNYLYDDNRMDIDGTVLLRFSKHVKGVIRASQIATGEENNFRVSIYGQKGGLRWEQENPNYLYYLTEDKPLQVLKPGQAYNSAVSLDGVKMPPGHPEGIFDAMGNIYKGVARAIRNENPHPSEFPSLHDGVRGMNFIASVLKSHAQGNVWISMDRN